MERFIAAEGDTSSRRSAFLFLYNEAEELAIDFLNEHMDEVSSEMMRRVFFFFCGMFVYRAAIRIPDPCYSIVFITDV